MSWYAIKHLIKHHSPTSERTAHLVTKPLQHLLTVTSLLTSHHSCHITPSQATPDHQAPHQFIRHHHPALVNGHDGELHRVTVIMAVRLYNMAGGGTSGQLSRMPWPMHQTRRLSSRQVTTMGNIIDRGKWDEIARCGDRKITETRTKETEIETETDTDRDGGGRQRQIWRQIQRQIR